MTLSTLKPEVEELLHAHQTDNFRLQYQFYTRYEVNAKGKYEFQKATVPAHRQLMGTQSPPQKRSSHEETAPIADYLKQVLNQLHQLQQKHLAQFTTASATKKLTPYKGIVPGYGNPSVYETGLQLDAVFGFPFVPASSWQGVIRSWFVEQYFEGDESRVLRDTGFLHLFGSEELAGAILFLDAYPLSLHEKSLQPEILTPHNQKYYTEPNAIPTDQTDPSPVTYLVVKDTSFIFRFGIQHSQRVRVEQFSEGLFQGQTPLQVIADELPNIFRFYGLGARTKNGFGRGQVFTHSA